MEKVSIKHNHYYKKCPYESIDVYRVLELFNIVDPCLQHGIKKLLVAGGRGTKDIHKDIQEAIDSLTRWQEMRKEEDFAKSNIPAVNKYVSSRYPPSPID